MAIQPKRIIATIPVLGNVSINFVEISCEMYNLYKACNEFERQKSMLQLGVISYTCDGIKHTRYDYLILQCVISEIIENCYRGTAIAQGNLIINSKEYRGNDLIKAWILLSNFGHCKNTIGDEKTLLEFCYSSPTFRNTLLKPITDPLLLDWANKTIDNYNYLEFHHIISIRRIYQYYKTNPSKKILIIDLYKLLLIDSSKIDNIANRLKIDQLKSIYNNIRKLSIIALDSRDSSLPLSIDVLTTILSYEYYENKFKQSQLSDILDNQINLLYKTLYLNTDSVSILQSYVNNALAKCHEINHFTRIFKKSIESGLSENKTNNLRHIIRKETSYRYYSANKLYIKLKKLSETVFGLDASMDYNPLTKMVLIDFYIENYGYDNNILPKTLFEITRLFDFLYSKTARDEVKNYLPVITDVTRGAIKLGISQEDISKLFAPYAESQSNRLAQKLIPTNIKSYKDILWFSIAYHLKDGLTFDIDRSVNEISDYIAIKTDDYNSIDKVLTTKIDTITNQGRLNEIKQLRRATNRVFRGTTIICHERIKIYDYSKAPSERPVTDIDSVILKFNETCFILEFHESKSGSHPENEAKKDLRDKFIRALNINNSKGYRTQEVKEFGAKIRIVHQFKNT